MIDNYYIPHLTERRLFHVLMGMELEMKSD